MALSADGLVEAAGGARNDNNGFGNADNNGFDNAGHARVWAFNGTGWEQRGQDLDGIAMADGLFGQSVALSGDGAVAMGSRPNGKSGVCVRRRKRPLGPDWRRFDWRKFKGNGLLGGPERRWRIPAIEPRGAMAIGVWSNAGEAKVYALSADGTTWNQRGQTLSGEKGNDWAGTGWRLAATGRSLRLGHTGTMRACAQRQGPRPRVRV